jgi:hypothetical protein
MSLSKRSGTACQSLRLLTANFRTGMRWDEVGHRGIVDPESLRDVASVDTRCDELQQEQPLYCVELLAECLDSAKCRGDSCEKVFGRDFLPALLGLSHRGVLLCRVDDAQAVT